MEESWNFEIFWNFWKSHVILTKIAKGHGKVMEFLNWSRKSWKSHSGIFSRLSVENIYGKVREFCREDFVATLETSIFFLSCPTFDMGRSCFIKYEKILLFHITFWYLFKVVGGKHLSFLHGSVMLYEI